MPPPDEQKWKSMANEFRTRWNFPNCIGAVDGKHVVIQAPNSCGSMYYNYKGTQSIVLMALADANLKFTMIDVGAFGRTSDGGVFKNCAFGNAFIQGRINIPNPAPLYSDPNSTPFPFVILGDEAFPLRENLMRPYGGRGLTDEK
jgi:hypothetical protein